MAANRTRAREFAIASWTRSGYFRILLLLHVVLMAAVMFPERRAQAQLGGEVVPATQRLTVSANNRFLVQEDGTPFFYLADTAWSLPYRLSREEADQYLRSRVAQGYNVIQIVLHSWESRTPLPNVYGHRPFLNNDPSQPNEAYFQHVDYLITRAEALGLYVSLLPTWGYNVAYHGMFNTTSARNYGEWLGRRYFNRPNIIWLLGGDVYPEGEEGIWRAMARGIAIGVNGREDYSNVLMSFHNSNAAWSNTEPWLKFNMWQTGHCRDSSPWDAISRDYQRTPTKPVLDGEAVYEDIENCLSTGSPRITEYDVRKVAYWDVFAGAFGHTYGANGVFQFSKPGSMNGWNSRRVWQDALQLPGGNQMKHLRRLMESRPFLNRVPDQSVLVSSAGTGTDHIQATRASDGSYALVYLASGRAVTINLDKLSGSTVRGYWYDPRTGTATQIGLFPRQGTRQFTPPSSGYGNDWVLVLDDSARNFPPPGGGRTETNAAPSVSITRPSEGEVHQAPATVTITADAWDSDGAIARVEFYNGDVRLGADTTRPYEFVYSNLAPGQYSISARATDNQGAVGVSNTVTITVNGNTTPGGFLKGINLAGNAVTIEGNRWLSYAEAQASGLSATSASTWAGNYSFPLSPAADADTKRMLEGVVWRAGAGNGQGFRLRQTVPNGSYQVYLWCIENYTSHFRNLDVKLEGVTVASRIGDLPLGTWRKYGPYPATVTDGALDLEILRGTKGDPVLMGLALFSAGGGTGPTPPTEPTTYSIRGKVSAGTSGLSGVTVTAGSTSTTTAADGTYTLSGLTAGSYTVTAAKTGYDVTPASRSVTVGPNQTGVDFSATPQAPSTYSIRGIVRVNGTGLPGVTVRTEGASATTASDGSYTLSGLPAGTYSVSASRAEYTFNGPRSVTLGPDQSGIDFTGTRLTYAVRGRVTVNGTGLSGVTVAAGSTSTTTAADGSYTLSGLPAGTYSVTPARSGYGFTPANRSVTVGPDQTGIDFSGSPTGGTPGGFLKGINLAGDAVTIEGNRWLSYSQALASGLSATSASTYRGSYSFPLSPAADADTKRMLESTVWRAGAGNGQGFRLRQTVPNGSYQVYLWCIENYTSHFRNMDVKLEGVTVASRIGDLPLGTWRKYGPYPATVTDGALDLEILRGTKGDPILMGLAIFSAGN